MAAPTEPIEINLPELPAQHDGFIPYIAANKDKPMLELLEPFKQYDTEMRKVFAQKPDHPAVKCPSVTPVFAGHEDNIRIRARNLKEESPREKDSFIMPLKDTDRRSDGQPAIVQSFKEFQTNFNVFSESSLVDMDWSNVVVAGSAVVTSLLAVPEKHGGSKRALRQYYHEQLAPASDVDLFLYGLTEAQAMEKIRQIEQSVRDALLVETTTIRTKNAITIASQYPTRHVQIVLRIYKSISEILTGFDVDCSCAAYDGSQVYASPRALAAYMTQINTVDLTRRSPSYENRLSKYAHRGFEVYWPNLDRSRIDPTIFERSFGRTEGLARLLILEKLPKSEDRDAYLDQRRAERGRPAINRHRMNRRRIYGNIKDDHEDEVAEWVDADDVSDYHTFNVPYGVKFHARKIEKLLYTKDLLLNSEWNKPKDREVNLHRHPAFFGRTEDVFHDCCGYCPQPSTVEEEEVAEEENKIYISGEIGFIKDDPGRQAIGSFNPLTADDWTEMAYVGNTEQLCKAIVDGDSDFVRSWLEQDGNDPNTRDYTGRSPLHLAAANSTAEIVQLLIDKGARMVARLVDGRTALHLAAMRGNAEMVSALLRKSEANEEEEEKKVDARRATRAATKSGAGLDTAMKDVGIEDDQPAAKSDDNESDVDMVDDADDDEDMDATTENSMVNIKSPAQEAVEGNVLESSDDNDEPDVFDVNVVAWDTAVSPLHLAIVNGHVDVVKLLVQEFGADVLLPIKLFTNNTKSARAAVLTLVLALQLPVPKAEEMARTLLSLGASIAQADMNQNTTLQYSIVTRPDLIESLLDADKTGFGRAINHLASSASMYNPQVSSPLMTAIQSRDSLSALLLLTNGAKPSIDFPAFMKAYTRLGTPNRESKRNQSTFEKTVQQPIVSAVRCELPELAKVLLEQYGVDPNTLTTDGWTVIYEEYRRSYSKGSSLLDEVRAKISALQDWKAPEKDEPEPPVPLRDDASYFANLEEGSYQWWSAQKQLDSAKSKYNSELKQYKKVIETPQDRTGIAEKQAAVDDMAKRFSELESVLVQKGAKTFSELYPDIKEPEEREPYQFRGYTPEKPKPFEVEFNFQLPDLTDEKNARYVALFEAAWAGDLHKVKELALVPWTDEEGDEQPPLTIAVQDQHNLSPFAIAILQGQFELGTAIMEIAKAQYVPPDEAKQQRYGLDGGEDSEEDTEDDGGESDVKLYSEVVDDEFTVENVGEVSTQVKSRVKPLTMLLWNYPVSFFASGPLRSSPQRGDGFSYFGPRRQTTMAGKRTNTGSLKAPSNHLSDAKRSEIGLPRNLIQFALHQDDHDLLTYLLSLGDEYTKIEVKSDDEGAKRFFAINNGDFLEAIKLDRPHLVSEIIKRTGAGIPMDQLVKKSGVEVKEKPKYYQGLSVHGVKRKDWADAGRNESGFEPVENHRPPLLEAAHSAALETVEWFLSDAPMRCYQEFARSNQDDRRVKLLSEAEGGFEASVSRFLNARSKLAIHCALMCRPVPETTNLLKFLVKNMPEAINHKAQGGLTPLAVAFRLFRLEAAKTLIDAGADQTTRDRMGNNLVHNLLKSSMMRKKQLQQFTSMLELIDTRLLKSMFTERTGEHPGSLTPLAQAISTMSHGRHNDDVIKTLLKWSKGEALNMINGEGHAPIHVTVGRNEPSTIKIILDEDPTMVLRENATGRTPFEIGEDAAIAAVCNDPPALPHHWNSFGGNTKESVIDRDARTFVEKESQKSSRDEVWDLLQETKAKLEAQGIAKRRLVTLNEANEVARRLAAKKAGRRYLYASSVRSGESADEEYDVADEVALWLPNARVYTTNNGQSDGNSEDED